MSLPGGKVSPDAVRLALATSPFERGLRESGFMPAVRPGELLEPPRCVRCLTRDAEEGSLFCGPWCQADAELTALFAEDEEGLEP